MTYGETVSAVILGSLIFHGAWWLVRLPSRLRASKRIAEKRRRLEGQRSGTLVCK